MVKGQQSNLPAVSLPSLSPAHCTPEVVNTTDHAQCISFFPEFYFLSDHHGSGPICNQIWQPWKVINILLLVYKEFSRITIKYRLSQKLYQCYLIPLWKEKYLSKYRIYVHTCTLRSLFFSLQVYSAGILLIISALLTSRSAYQCSPSHTWTAHHTAQFGTTHGTWEKSLNWKRKRW